MTLLRSAVPQQPSTPSLGLILWRDLATLISGVALIGGWLVALPVLTLGYLPVYIGRFVFSAGEKQAILLLTLLFSSLLLTILFLRIRTFRSILTHGIPVTGQVSRLVITPFEYRVEYVFGFQDRPQRGLTAIRRSTLPTVRSSLEPGRTAQLLVHKYLPERSILLHLYRSV